MIFRSLSWYFTALNGIVELCIVLQSSVRPYYIAFLWLKIVIQIYVWYFTAFFYCKGFFCIQQVHIKLSRYFKDIYRIYQLCLVFHSKYYFYSIIFWGSFQQNQDYQLNPKCILKYADSCNGNGTSLGFSIRFLCFFSHIFEQGCFSYPCLIFHCV